MYSFLFKDIFVFLKTFRLAILYDTMRIKDYAFTPDKNTLLLSSSVPTYRIDEFLSPE